MTEIKDLIQPDRGQDAIAIHLVNKDGFSEFAKTLSAGQRAALAAQKFDGSGYQVGIVPDGDSFFAVGGVANPDNFQAGALPSWPKTCPKEPIALLVANPARQHTAG